MTTSRRLTYAEVLRRAREQTMLTLAATNAAIERRERDRSGLTPSGALTGIQSEIDRLIVEQEGQTLSCIETALRRLRETPELFGVCIECGDPIPPERLAFAPWGTHCDAHALSRYAGTPM